MQGITPAVKVSHIAKEEAKTLCSASTLSHRKNALLFRRAFQVIIYARFGAL